MKHLRWVCAGVLVGLAGTVALAIATAPSRSTAVSAAPAAAPVVAVTPAVPVVATTPVPAAPAPVVARAPRAAEKETGIVPGSSGMLIAIDPETGTVGMPSPEQVAEMKLSEDETVSKDGGYTITQRPNGTVVLETNGRFQEYAVIRRTTDGKYVTGCVDDPKHLNTLVPAPAGLEEK